MTAPVAPGKYQNIPTAKEITTDEIEQLTGEIALPAISAVAKFVTTPFSSPSVKVLFTAPEARSKFETAIFKARESNEGLLTEKGSLFPQNLRFRSIKELPCEIFIYWANENKSNNSNKIIDTLQAIKV